MQRRTFLKTMTVAPLALPKGTNREIRESLLVSGETEVHMIVKAHVTADSAERYRKDWTGRAFETDGEWYVIDSETRQLPTHLADMPGSLSFHFTLFGEAAEEQEYLTGTFRRDHIACIVRIRQDDEPLMLDFAEHIAAQSVPTPLETSWSAAQLRNFVPTSDDIGVDIEVADSFWP